jgi:hypothetical protein
MTIVRDDEEEVEELLNFPPPPPFSSKSCLKLWISINPSLNNVAKYSSPQESASDLGETSLGELKGT